MVLVAMWHVGYHFKIWCWLLCGMFVIILQYGAGCYWVLVIILKFGVGCFIACWLSFCKCGVLFCIFIPSSVLVFFPLRYFMLIFVPSCFAKPNLYFADVVGTLDGKFLVDVSINEPKLGIYPLNFELWFHIIIDNKY